MKKRRLFVLSMIIFGFLLFKTGAPVRVWAGDFGECGRETKTGKYYIWTESVSRTIRISKSRKGNGTVLARAAKGREIRNCFSDGKTVYYAESEIVDEEWHTVDYLYRIGTNKKGKKYLNKVRNFSQFTAWYKGKVYMSCTSEEFIDCLHTYCLDTKTKKIKRVMKDSEVWKQKGKYLIAEPNSGDVRPLPLYIYNCASEKKVRIVKKGYTAQFVGKRIYYAEFLNKDWETINSFRIRSCNPSGAGKKTVVKEIQATSIGKMTSKYIYYQVNRSWGNFYYRYVIKTKRSQELTASQYRE